MQISMPLGDSIIVTNTIEYIENIRWVILTGKAFESQEENK